MTRRNFIAIAKILNRFQSQMPPETHIALVNALGDEFRRFNPAFDMTRFAKAARDGK